jgi:hypothetical protein
MTTLECPVCKSEFTSPIGLESHFWLYPKHRKQESKEIVLNQAMKNYLKTMPREEIPQNKEEAKP